MVSKNDDATGSDDTLAYFTKFLETFSVRMDSVDSKIDALDTDVSALFARIENGVDVVQEPVKLLTDRGTSVDTTEILISGIPRSTQLTHNGIVSKFLALGLPHLTHCIVSVRLWNGPDLVPFQNVPNMEPQAGTVNRTPNPNFFTLVMKLVPTVVRDEVISRTPTLKDKTVFSILEILGDSQIFCRAFWPREVYQLYRKSLVASKTLNYERSVVRNLKVCMHGTRTSRLIPILSDSELDVLPPHPPPAQ
ncbi:hypothetical protein QAD02_013948 [Eretmocerus hayati]|uniref:Uncharacterized protein n=1 Tax=Eretmocerus hayati TaxID=131215 RepID=A0ACC2P5N5_9HYME|nr:hypothetical protein QAD02_013948 [Eretmocerus hayati]